MLVCLSFLYLFTMEAQEMLANPYLQSQHQVKIAGLEFLRKISGNAFES